MLRRGLIAFLAFAPFASAQFDDGPSAAPAASTLPDLPASTQPNGQPTGRFPFIQIDVKAKQVRVDCQMLGITAPLEFFCVLNGTNEHESVLRTKAQPSKIHLGLLMLGLTPGAPVTYSEPEQKWIPPHGPNLQISAEFMKDGKLVHCPASRLMRSIKTKQPMPNQPFIFAGSQLAEGSYAADVTGYVVSIVNFDLSLIDVPQLASSANETLEWEIDHDFAPPTGAAVTMIIEPMRGAVAPQIAPTTASAAVDLQTIKIDSAGAIRLNERLLSIDQLKAELQTMQRDHPLRVRVASALPDEPATRGVMQMLQGLKIDFAPVDQNPPAGR